MDNEFKQKLAQHYYDQLLHWINMQDDQNIELVIQMFDALIDLLLDGVKL